MKAVAEGALMDPQPAFPPAEWKARVELAACYRIFAMLGWTELIYNHITRAAARPGQAFPHQSVRPALQRGVRVEPGQDRPCRQYRRHVRVAGQPRRLHCPCGDPRRHSRRALHHAHAYDGRHGGGMLRRRSVADQFLFRAVARQGRVPRLRGHHRARRRRPASGAQHRRPAGGDPAQPRPARVGATRCLARSRSCGRSTARARSSSRRWRWAR